MADRTDPLSADRDVRAAAFGRMSQALRAAAPPPVVWGAEVSLPYAREDLLGGTRPWDGTPAPRTMHQGFAHYVAPMVNPADYVYAWCGAWRIALPVGLSQEKKVQLIEYIYKYGPRPAGYVAAGDTLVPGRLDVQDRQALASVGWREDLPGLREAVL